MQRLPQMTQLAQMTQMTQMPSLMRLLKPRQQPRLLRLQQARPSPRRPQTLRHRRVVHSIVRKHLGHEGPGALQCCGHAARRLFVAIAQAHRPVGVVLLLVARFFHGLAGNRRQRARAAARHRLPDLF